ncbi:MAG: DctP family TRAP transporter solute-binding subunit [SAR324 cluster bacterium]|nr:DctP family TRAP transporter solute-binding subunit [SAR324 cluster bacterium]
MRSVIITTLTVLSGIVAFLVYWQNDSQPPPLIKKIYELKLGHNIYPDSALHIAAVRFAKVVDRRSKGQLKVSVFPAQELGTDHQMIEAAREGKLDILITPSAKLSNLVPSLQYPDLPFLFPSREDAYALLDGEPGSMLLQQLEPYGLKGAAFWENGFKQFTANKMIRTPGDFKGLNIRIMKTTIIAEQFKALGANPIPIDFHATYQALKDGVVDGEENPLVAIVNMKFHEVQSDLIISNHAYLSYVFAFSKSVFESLPADLQDILFSSARELAEFEREETQRHEERFMQVLKTAGVRIYQLSENERSSFREATAHITENFASVVGEAVLQKTREFLIEKYGEAYHRDDMVYLGLNADMSLGAGQGGVAIQRGMELAIEEINQQGGVLGKKIGLIIKDHAGIPARAVLNFKFLSKIKNLVAVIGGVHSNAAIAEQKLVHREKMLYLVAWAAATILVENGYEPNYVFRLSVNDRAAGEFLTAHALKRSKRVALLLENSEWGRSNQKGMNNALAKRNRQPVATEWFNSGEQNMTSQLAQIEREGAGVILLVANPLEGINILQDMQRRPRKIPIVSHGGITSGEFWNNTRQALQQIDLSFIQTFSFFNADHPKTADILQKYYQAYQVNEIGKVISPVGTAHAYDLIHLLALAINKAHSFDRPAIRDAMERIEFYDGLVRKYRFPFTSKNHEALTIDDYQMAKYNKQGYIVPIRNEN